MPLPDNITTIQVKGKYLDIFGNPIIGKVSFSIKPVLVNAGAEVVIIPRTVEAPLRDDGSFEAILPATNDPDVAPTNFTIQVTEQFEGGGGEAFNITLPEGTPQPVDITKFARSGTPPNGGTITYATQAALNAESAARVAGDAALLAKLPDYVNVKGAPYNAKGDDTTDDTAAIQAAIDACPEGGIVYLPVGKYATSAPLRTRPHVTVQGTHANGEQLPTDTAPRSSIRPLASFVGDAVIKVDDKTEGGYADESREQRIYDLSIDGERIPPGTIVDGIKVYGYVQSFNMRDVCIWKVTGNGVITLVNPAVTTGSQAPLAMKWERVVAYEVGATGFVLINPTDSTLSDVIALGCNQDGWYIEGAANSIFSNCRSEWASGEGFKVQAKFGPVTFDACTTDSSDFNGMSIIGGDWDSSVLLLGCRFNRDGRNGGAGGGGYSGLRVDTNVPVIVDGIVVNVRRDDNTTGPLRPDYGITVTNSQELIVNSGYLNAMLGGINNLGGNAAVLRGANVEEKIGNMIGAASLHKRGLRAEPDEALFFTATGVEHDLIRNSQWEPQDQGFIGWSIPFDEILSTSPLVSGVMQLIAVKVRSPRLVSKVMLGVGTAGAGLTAGQNLIGLYDMAGARLAVTADQSVAWSTVGEKTADFVTPVTVDKGIYWVAVLPVGTTPPQLLRASSSGTLLNSNLPSSAARFGTHGAGQTALPANLTLGNIAKASNAFAVALL